MPLPVDFNTGHINFHAETLSGDIVAPMVGSVSFNADVSWIVDPSVSTAFYPVTRTVLLDSAGSLSVDLAAGGDTDISPTGWTYTVVENFTGGRPPYHILVNPGDVIDLSTVVDVDPVTGEAQVIGPAGVTWRGTWNGALAYSARDGVYYSGSSYRAVVDIAANGATPSPTASTPWTLIALSGSGTDVDVRTSTVTGAGASDGDLGAAVAAAFAAGANVVRVPRTASYYQASTTILVPTGKSLVFDHAAEVRPTADVNVVELQQDGFVQGGLINISNFTGFTSAAFVIKGTTTFGTPNVLPIADRVRIRGAAGATAAGTGVLIDSGTTNNFRVSYAHLRNFHIRGCAISVKMVSRTPTTGSTWITGNILANFTLSQPNRGLEMVAESDLSTTQCAGNHLIGWQFQSVSTLLSVIRLSGKCSYNVIAPFMLWDFNTPLGANPDLEAVVLGPVTSYNTIQTSVLGQYVRDKGKANKVDSRGALAMPHGSFVRPGNNPYDGSFAGNQDDFLTYATTRYTVSQTAGSAPSSGTLARLFDPDSGLFTTWAAASLPITIEVDFGGAPPGRIWSSGITFNSTNAPFDIAVEMFDGGSWVAVDSVTNFQATQFTTAQPMGTGTLTKVRWTLSGTSVLNTISAVRVERIWAFCEKSHGFAWSRRDHTHGSTVPTPSVSNVSGSTGAAILDTSATDSFVRTVTGTTTFSLTNLVAGRTIRLTVIQDGTGGRSYTLPTSRWSNAVPPSQSSAAAARDVYAFWSDDGTTVDGALLGSAMA